MADIGMDTITVLNRDFARLRLGEGRAEAVRIELTQLAAALDKVRSSLDFDSEPSDFAAVLLGPARERADG